MPYQTETTMILERINRSLFLDEVILKTIPPLEVFGLDGVMYKAISLNVQELVLKNISNGDLKRLNVIGGEIMTNDIGIILNKDIFVSELQNVINML